MATINLNDATPTAPAGKVNVKWQADSNNPRNVSAYVDVASGSAVGGVNVQTGTTYAFLTTDTGKLVSFSNAGAVAAALAVASSFVVGWFVFVENRGVGDVTITATTSTIDGAASFVLSTGQGVGIFSDGTNYYLTRGRPSNMAELDGGLHLKTTQFPAITGDVTTAAGSVSSTVVKVQNIAWKTGTPNDGDIAVYVAGNTRWEATAPGSVSGISATQLRGKTISSATPAPGDILQYSQRTGGYDLIIPRHAMWGPATGAGTTFATAGFYYAGNPASYGATSSTVSSTTEPMGLLNPTASSANSAAGCSLLGASSANAGINILSLGNHCRFVRWRAKLSGTATIRAWIGVTDATGSSVNPPSTTLSSNTPAANFIGFRYSTSATDAHWKAVTQTDATHQTVTDTGIVVDTNVHNFMVAYDGAAYNFYIDDVLVATQSTNAPAVTVLTADIIHVDNVAAANVRSFTIYGITLEYLNG